MAAAIVSNTSPWRAVVWVAAIAVVLAVFPPFHVRSLNEAPEPSSAIGAPPSAEESARELWERLLASSDSAVDAGTLLDALERDPSAADREYGRRIGYGGPAFYFVRGQGRVTETTRTGVMLEIAGHTMRVKLVMGPVFGNALRDSTALVDMRDFDSFQFNALSSELNLLSERRVQPRLAEIGQPGTSLRFIGGAKYVRRGQTTTLEIVPIDVERAD